MLSAHDELFRRCAATTRREGEIQVDDQPRRRIELVRG